MPGAPAIKDASVKLTAAKFAPSPPRAELRQETPNGGHLTGEVLFAEKREHPQVETAFAKG